MQPECINIKPLFLFMGTNIWGFQGTVTLKTKNHKILILMHVNHNSTENLLWPCIILNYMVSIPQLILSSLFFFQCTHRHYSFYL